MLRATSSEREYKAAYQAGVNYLEPLEPTRDLIDFLPRYLHGRNLQALDFGCGEGRDTVFLAKRGFGAIGLDSSPSAIRKARLRALREKVRAQFRVADMTRPTGFKENRFDLAINIDNIHAVYRKSWRLSHFREAHRILKNGGLYFLCTHTARKSRQESAGVGVFNFIVAGENEPVRLSYEPSFIGTAKGYQAELQSTGFEILCRKIGQTPPIPARTCTIIAMKPRERAPTGCVEKRV